MKEVEDFQDLETLLREHIYSAVEERDLKETDRAEAHRYYRGALYAPEVKGRSNHVSRDVYSTAEATKSKLLACLAGSRQIVRFTPRDQDDVLEAEIRNNLLNDIFWGKNNGYRLLHDGIHDALIGKLCSYRWFYEEKYDVETIPVEAVPVAEFGAALQQYEANGFEFELEGEQDGLVYGAFVKRHDISHVKIRTIAPERVLYDANATCVDDAVLIGEEAHLTGSDLVELGVDKDALSTLDEDDIEGNISMRARQAGSFGFTGNGAATPEQKVYRVFDGWIRVDLDGDGISELYHVLTSMDGKLLRDIEPARRPQMVSDSLIPIPHTFGGMSQADLTMDIQRTTSMIKRQFIDHLARTNNSRTVADFGMIRNPADLINNRVGSVINAEFINGAPPVSALPVPQLSPNSSVALEMIDKESESRSGLSRLSQGLNGDATSKQNSASLIDRMATASTARVMTMARHFAENILKPMLEGVWELSTELDDRPVSFSIGGNWQTASPKQIGSRSSLIVDVAITDDEAMMRIQSMLTLHNTMAQSPMAQSLYTERQQFATFSELAQLMGIKNTHAFIQNPNDPNFAPPVPMLQQELQAMQQQNQQMTAQIDQLQHEYRMLQLALTAKEGDLKIKQAELIRKTEQEQQKFNLDVEKQEHDEYIAEEELKLDKRQAGVKSEGK